MSALLSRLYSASYNGGCMHLNKRLIYLSIIIFSFVFSSIFLISCWDGPTSEEIIDEVIPLSFVLASDSTLESSYDSSEIVAAGDTITLYAVFADEEKKSLFEAGIDRFDLSLIDSSGKVVQNSVHSVSDTADSAVQSKLFISRFKIDTVGVFELQVIARTSEKSFLEDTASIEVQMGRRPVIDSFPYPQNLSLPLGGSLTFRLTLKEGTDTRYQWFKDNVVLDGETIDTLMIGDLKGSNSGKYHCLVSNLWGSIFSDMVNVSVIDNSAPKWIDSIEQFVLRETDTIQINLKEFCEDPDGDLLHFSLIGSSLLSGTISDSFFNYITTYNDGGHYTLEIEASDLLLADTADIRIEVKNVNRVPQWDNLYVIPSLKKDEGLSFSVIDHISDSDGDDISITLDSVFYNSSLFDKASLVEGILQIDAADCQIGTYLFYFTASDGIDFVARPFPFILIISNNNISPVWNPVSHIPTVNENEIVLFPIGDLVYDPDGDSITLTLDSTTLQGTLYVGAVLSEDTIKLITDHYSAGDYIFYTSASDGTQPSPKEFTLTVNNVNRSLKWSALSVIPSVDEGTTVSFNLLSEITDPDKDDIITFTLEFTLFNGMPYTGAVIENGELRMETTDGSGIYNFNIIASDGSDSLSKLLTLTVNIANQAPQWEDTSVIPSLNENAPLSFYVRPFVNDPDGDSVTVTLDSSTFAGNVITDAVLVNDTIQMSTTAGEYVFYLSASDGESIVQKQFTLTVNNVNQAPIWNGLSTIPTIEENVSLSFYTKSFVSDPDGDSVTIALDSTTFEGNPSGAAVFNNDSILMNTDYNSAGSYVFYISITDGYDTVIQELTFTVSNKNRLPVWDSVSAMPLVFAGNVLSFEITSHVSDPDGDILILSVNSATHNGNKFTGSLINKPYLISTGPLLAGNYVFNISASDGSVSVNKTFTLTVFGKIIIKLQTDSSN